MTQRELHPDALIELHRQGVLSDEARSDLAAHLERCPACAAEVWAANVLVRECEPQSGDSALDRLAVQATLARLASQPARPKRPRRTWPWALAAALPLCALAALGPRLFGGQRSREQQAPTPPSAAPVAPRQGQPVPPLAVAPSALPEAPAPEPQSSKAVVSPAPVPALSGRSESLGPSELLRRAGDLDREGKRAQAIDVYRELQQRFAASAEAKLSRVLVGSLLLAQGQYAPAVAQFDRYLASSGPASEEALAGRATALQALGNQPAEAASWRTLLERFPRSVHASHARQRLAAITAPTDAQNPL